MITEYSPASDAIEYIKDCLKKILSDGSDWQEFNLLKKMQEDVRLSTLLTPVPGDTLALYRVHFLLFHALYCLADDLAQSQQALLEISPLRIRCCSYMAGQQQLTQPNLVREYYLDWKNYALVDAHGVDELLASFWVGLHKLDHRQEALAILELTDPVDDETIRKTYQRLAMRHHPDRGGDDWKLQEINAAVKLLLK